MFLYRGGSGCEKLWKQIEHQHITLVEQSAEHAPAELILNARAYRRPRSNNNAPAVGVAGTVGSVGVAAVAMIGVAAGGVPPTVQAEVQVGGLLMKLSLPSRTCCRELAQLLHGLSDKA